MEAMLYVFKVSKIYLGKQSLKYLRLRAELILSNNAVPRDG